MINSDQELIVDKVTTRQRPSADQVRQWASRQNVFISSTMEDLGPTRSRVSQTISEFGAEPVLFENFGARSDDSRQAYKGEVRRSTIYLGILSRLYGTKLPSGYSATHEEYEEALQYRKELLLFLDASVPDNEREGHLNRWIKELYQFHVLAKYQDSSELMRLVRSSLERIASEELTPWVKLGQSLFQVNRIERSTQENKTVITLTTSSRDPHVTSELESLIQGRFGRSPLHLTYGRESFPVRVEGLQAIVDPIGGNALKLTCLVVEDNQQRAGSSFFMLGASYQGPSGSYSNKDLVTIGLRGIILGENPPRDPMLGGMPRLDFREIYRKIGDDHYVFPKILQLLTVEMVYESGIQARVIHYSVGRIHDGQVHVAFSAILPRQYSNAEPETIEFEGEVQLA